MKNAVFLLPFLAFACLRPHPGVPGGALNAAPAPAGDYITRKMTLGSASAPRVWVLLYDGRKLTGRSPTADDGRHYIGKLDDDSHAVVVRKSFAGANLISHSVGRPQNRVFDIHPP